MCRVRFRADGIYLSLPYIELLDEPCYPLEGVYERPLSSTVPQSVAEYQDLRKDLTKHLRLASQVMEGKSHWVIGGLYTL